MLTITPPMQFHAFVCLKILKLFLSSRHKYAFLYQNMIIVITESWLIALLVFIVTFSYFFKYTMTTRLIGGRKSRTKQDEWCHLSLHLEL